MRTVLAAAVVAFAFICQAAFAAETFEHAWATRWRPQVTGSILSRRFEPDIKKAAHEIWDVAQANVPRQNLKLVQPTIEKITPLPASQVPADIKAWATENHLDVICDEGSWYKQVYLRPKAGFCFRHDDEHWYGVSKNFTKGESWEFVWNDIREYGVGFEVVSYVPPSKAAGPLIAANKAIVKVKTPAARRSPIRHWRRRGLFR